MDNVAMSLGGVSAGPSKLPQLGKGLGKTFKSFQTAAKEFEKELKEEMTDEEKVQDEDSTPSSSTAPSTSGKEKN